MKKTLAIILYVLGLAGNHCYAACNAANAVDGEIEVWRDGVKVSNNGIVYIYATAVLPTLTAKLTGAPSGTVVWTLDQEYTDGNREDGPGYGPKSQSATLDWNINASLNSHFIGGKITVKLKDDDIECPFVFYIRGINPSTNLVYTYIGTSPWYSIPIVKTESTTRQFASNGCPLRSYDNGFGLYQLTDPKPTLDQLWNWKANVDGGKNKINQAISIANFWMNAPLGSPSKPEGGQRVQSFTDLGYTLPVTDELVGGITFKDGTSKPIEDAVAIKIFNSASTHYCYWSRISKVWGFSRLNARGENYVAKVCTHAN
jgi:hypothetical protein